jgi:hypothetical protein
MHTIRVPDALYEHIRERARSNLRATNQQALCMLYKSLELTPPQSKDKPKLAAVSLVSRDGRG